MPQFDLSETKKILELNYAKTGPNCKLLFRILADLGKMFEPSLGDLLPAVL